MHRPHLALLPLIACVGVAAPSLADHIEGHDNDSNIFPVPIPGHDDFSGGAAWVHAIGPFAGREILSATFDITYVSDGTTPASEMLLNVGLWVEGSSGQRYVETVVTGADLGFGSGAGTFHGVLETHDLDGVPIVNPLFPPYSSVDIIIGAVNGGIEGKAYFVDSVINFHLAPVPAPATAVLLGLAGAAASRRRR